VQTNWSLFMICDLSLQKYDPDFRDVI